MNYKKINWSELKTFKEIPKNYLNTDKFSEFLTRKKISVRKDNLPRFAFNHNIKIAKTKREGPAGSVPTIYKVPTKSKLEEIKKTMSLNNNNLLGKENVEKKERKILEIFDNAENKKESKSSIANKVTEVLGIPCNRKLVRRVLSEKRSSRLNKLL